MHGTMSQEWSKIRTSQVLFLQYPMSYHKSMIRLCYSYCGAKLYLLVNWVLSFGQVFACFHALVHYTTATYVCPHVCSVDPGS